jgi:copper chaperone
MTDFLSIFEGGVSEFTVNLDTQEVLVTGTVQYDDVYERIKKTGKEVCRSFA